MGEVNFDVGVKLCTTIKDCKETLEDEIVLDAQTSEQALLFKTGPNTFNAELVIKGKKYPLAYSGEGLFRAKMRPFANILKPGEKTRVVFKSGKYYKNFILTRSRESEIPRNPGFAIREIVPLQAKIAADLKEGEPLVVHFFLALWDKSFEARPTPGKKRPINDGNDLEHNLYWKAGDGANRVFQKAGWDLVYDVKDVPETRIAERVIFKSPKPFSPAGIFKKMGVKDPFYAYVVFDAYRSKHINHAYNDCAWNLSGLKVSWEMERDVLPVDGRHLKIGGYSHVVGYSGHWHPPGLEYFSRRMSQFKEYIKEPRGFLAICCYSSDLAQAAASRNVYGLLYTNSLMYPGAYSHMTLVRSLAEGKSGKEILHDCQRVYSRNSKSGGQPFISPVTPGMDRFWDPYQ